MPSVHDSGIRLLKNRIDAARENINNATVRAQHAEEEAAKFRARIADEEREIDTLKRTIKALENAKR